MNGLDDDFLTDWARQRQSVADLHNRRGGDRCTTCPHPWHGLPCPVVGGTPCTCKSSFAKVTS